MKKKVKIAIVSLTSCEGCQFTLLDLGEKFFNFLKKVELIDFGLIEDKPLPKNKSKIDIVFVEGNPITKKDVELLKKVRNWSKKLVVIGNCAALGGIPEMKNYQNKEKTIRFFYKNFKKNVANPEIKEVDNFIKVDFTIPGCPISGEEFLKLAGELIKGKIPEVCQSPVCSECPHRGKETCFLVRKKTCPVGSRSDSFGVCFGLVALAGCGAVCLRNEFPCYACRGLLKKSNIKALFNALKTFHSKEEIEDCLEIFGVRDDFEERLK